MSNFSRGLLAATLTSSLAFAGATAASAEETATSCGSPKAEFTATVDGKEHTFKKVSEFVWQATDDEKVELNRAEIFDLAKDGEDVCDSEPIDIDEPDTDNDGGGSEDDETDGDDDKNKDKSSFDGIKDALSSKDGKPTDLGIAAIVIGVLGALAAIVPNAARALGIKLPF